MVIYFEKFSRIIVLTSKLFNLQQMLVPVVPATAKSKILPQILSDPSVNPITAIAAAVAPEAALYN